MDKEERNEEKISPIRDKSNIFSSKQQVGEIYVSSISSINIQTTKNDASDGQDVTTGGSSIESKTDANIQVGAHCFNRARISTLHPSLGKLRRIYPMGSITWTKCQFVQPYNKNNGCSSEEPMPQVSKNDLSCMSNKNSRNSTMIVEIIDNGDS